MASRGELMAAGTPAIPARMLGQTIITGISAAGTTQATATTIGDGISVVSTVGINAGVVIQSATGSSISGIYNNGQNTLTVYPLLGESFVGQSANAGYPCAVGKTLTLMPHLNTWLVNPGA